MNLGDRTLTANLDIGPGTGSAPPSLEAILSQGPLTLQNRATVDDNDGNAATGLAILHTNGAFTCDNYLTNLEASVRAPTGPVNIRYGCKVRGDVSAYGSVSVFSSEAYEENFDPDDPGETATIHGNAESSAGSLSVSGEAATLFGNATVNGTVSKSEDAFIFGSRTQGVPTANFTSYTKQFPYQRYKAPVWNAAGFTQVFNLGTDCSSAATQASTTPVNGQRIVILGDCAMGTSTSTSTITARTDVALILKRGFSGKSTIASDNPAAQRNVYLIVPAGTGGMPAGWNPPASCSTGNLSLGAGTTTSAVNLFVYTPCALSTGGSVDITGQLFGGTVSAGSSSGFTLRYVDVVVPGDSMPGRAAGTATVTITSRNEDN